MAGQIDTMISRLHPRLRMFLTPFLAGTVASLATRGLLETVQRGDPLDGWKLTAWIVGCGLGAMIRPVPADGDAAAVDRS